MKVFVWRILAVMKDYCFCGVLWPFQRAGFQWVFDSLFSSVYIYRYENSEPKTHWNRAETANIRHEVSRRPKHVCKFPHKLV